jgi:hypothetical protein
LPANDSENDAQGIAVSTETENYTLAAALVLASVYVFGHRPRARSHRRWVSIAAGVSVSTIFIDLLPEISESQAAFLGGPHSGTALFPEQAIYLSALLGFVLFYGFQCMVAVSASKESEPSRLFFSLQIAAFAGYSSFIAYLLVHNIWNDARSMFLYALAMAFHLFLVGHSLAQEHPRRYESRGRWILALAIMGGWGAGMITSIPEHWLARIAAFVSGGVIMNSLVVELGEGRGGRFWPFALAAATYSIVLILVLR